MSNTFNSYHPSISFFYFAAVITLSVLFMHPVFLAISLIASVCYALHQKKFGAPKMGLIFIIPIFLLLALVNPLINHRGREILFHFQNNPITLESTIYGFCNSFMLIAVLLWFVCYNAIITSDKFIYLFGKISPAIALILSMTLRLIPRMKNQLTTISQAQRTIGRDASCGNIVRRTKNGMSLMSVLTSWALENSIETADSMRARGYGLPQRSSFGLFCFTRRDTVLGSIIIALVSVCVYLFSIKTAKFFYYPRLRSAPITSNFVILAVCYAILCFLPLILECIEFIKWKLVKS